MALNAEQRTTRARNAAIAMWAKPGKDRTAHTANGRAAFDSRFSSDEERSDYYRNLALKSVAVRRAKSKKL